MASRLRILITTGDPDGIGWEVTAKALNALGPKPGVQFCFFRSSNAAVSGPPFSKRFKIKTVDSIFQAAELSVDHKTLIEIRSPRPAPVWVEEAAHACMQNRFHALVTAPLSKTSIIAAGLKDIGHTEILSRVARTPDLFMGFIGKKFSVVLVTGHQPLREAVGSLSDNKLRRALKAAKELRSILPKKRAALPMAMLGVNPHAGERGLLGQEEIWIGRVLEQSAAEFGKIAGPLVPDAAFLPQNWDLFSVYLCPYHDQGLIPFKMVHGFKGGVHLTLGLPFVRTSVDHGTAKELFGKNKAEAGSMKEAIEMAIRLAKERSHA